MAPKKPYLNGVYEPFRRLKIIPKNGHMGYRDKVRRL